MARIDEFRIGVDSSELDDLRERLGRTRRPPRDEHGWSRGTDSGVLATVITHWRETFDWSEVERRWNALDHVRVPFGDLTLHAVRTGTPGATPLLLVHGWPDGFWRFESALPVLGDRFEIVVPSLPGYGFSDRPTAPTGPAAVAELLAWLMTALGHERFVVHGGDIGSTIAEQLALQHPERVLGLHLGDVPLHRARGLSPDEATEDDREWLGRLHTWEQNEGAYARLQRTKPQTLAVALEDSPAALAAWIVEKYHGWSDDFGAFTLDDLCTTLTTYWVTRTAGSSVHYYYDNATSPLDSSRVTVPTGFAQFPADILPAPRSSAERWFPVARWTEFRHGGHFGPWERPGEWAADVRGFADEIGA